MFKTTLLVVLWIGLGLVMCGQHEFDHLSEQGYFWLNAPPFGPNRTCYPNDMQAIANACHNFTQYDLLHGNGAQWTENGTYAPIKPEILAFVQETFEATERLDLAVDEYCVHLPSLVNCTGTLLLKLNCTVSDIKLVTDSLSTGMGFCDNNAPSRTMEILLENLSGQLWKPEKGCDYPPKYVDAVFGRTIYTQDIRTWMARANLYAEDTSRIMFEAYATYALSLDMRRCEKAYANWRRKFVYDLLRHSMPTQFGVTISCTLLSNLMTMDFCSLPSTQTTPEPPTRHEGEGEFSDEDNEFGGSEFEENEDENNNYDEYDNEGPEDGNNWKEDEDNESGTYDNGENEDADNIFNEYGNMGFEEGDNRNNGKEREDNGDDWYENEPDNGEYEYEDEDSEYDWD